MDNNYFLEYQNVNPKSLKVLIYPKCEPLKLKPPKFQCPKLEVPKVELSKPLKVTISLVKHY
jgi:hypothetical protein